MTDSKYCFFVYLNRFPKIEFGWIGHPKKTLNSYIELPKIQRVMHWSGTSVTHFTNSYHNTVWWANLAELFSENVLLEWAVEKQSSPLWSRSADLIDKCDSKKDIFMNQIILSGFDKRLFYKNRSLKYNKYGSVFPPQMKIIYSQTTWGWELFCLVF